MFSTNTFHSKARGPSRRSSEFGGNLLSFSQEENVRIRRASMDATATGIATRILECGVATAPIAYLYRSFQKSGSLKLYGAEEVGPVSLVGLILPHDNTINNPSLIQFKLSDGTGTAVIKYDVPSTPEGEIIADHIRKNLDDENSDPGLLKPLRVVGICETPEDNMVIVRAVNIREAAVEEYAYFHIVHAGTQYMRYIKGEKKKDADLPIRFKSVTDRVEQFVLKTVLADREEGLGISKSDLINKGRANGYLEDDISQALGDLDANNLVLLIEADGMESYVDIMPEE